MDYEALAGGLSSGRLGGAALDVYPEEPPGNAEELAALPNILLTPHIAGVTQQSKRNILMNTIANVTRVLNGEAPLYVVNQVPVRR
jgi:phosphoglycerate dehydrogenase-like enzyme